MRKTLVLYLLVGLLVSSFAIRLVAQVPVSQDTIVILGDIPNTTTTQHSGAIDSTINGDTTSTGARVNPNRVYALQEGCWYYQTAPINVNNPTGTLTIVGIPNSAGTTKPVILIQPTGTGDVGIGAYNAAVNEVYGSIKMVNIHYQTMQMNGYQNNELFYCGTANQLKQTLTIDNCLFEFSNIDIFDCTNESGAIGGWPYGASFFITNSYFRNMFHSDQWWGSRVFQCKHPIDTLWIANCTVTTGGLTFLAQNSLTAFAYFNHNTLVNNKKYWLQSPYYLTLIVTNNVFINQNWVGEDTNITHMEDPGGEFFSTINIDSISNGSHIAVQQRYYATADSSSYTAVVNPSNMRVFVSDNDNYDDTLMSPYYTNRGGVYDSVKYNYPLSYLNWYGLGSGPWQVKNIPGEWMNTRTAALFKEYPPDGFGHGFVEQNTVTGDPHTQTPGIADASVADQMARWNQDRWNDPRWPSTANNILQSKYIYGDYNPRTIPGVDTNGTKTENGIGIRRFTDLGENFSQTTYVSKIDGIPLGAQIWDDTENDAYVTMSAGYANSSEYRAIVAAAGSAEIVAVKGPTGQTPQTYELSQNYPNPFNPTTTILYDLPTSGYVTLKVYDVLGREVTTLVDEKQSAGTHTLTFNAANLPSGVYFCRLQAGPFMQTRKLMVIK